MTSSWFEPLAPTATTAAIAVIARAGSQKLNREQNESKQTHFQLILRFFVCPMIHLEYLEGIQLWDPLSFLILRMLN